MMASDFHKKLKRLNPRLQIFAGDNDSKPAGIFYVERGEYTEVCGVDKSWVPEYSEWSSAGRMTTGGWRRVLKVLLALHLTTRERIYSVFGHSIDYPAPQFKQEKSAIDREIQRIEATGKWKRDELVDVGREIEKRK